VPELGRTLGPGAILGDIGIVSPLQVRTTSAVCETEVMVLVLSAHQVLELYAQHPEVALYLGQLILRCLLRQIQEGPCQPGPVCDGQAVVHEYPSRS
jgi:CRP-like cAMP-binding protein